MCTCRPWSPTACPSTRSPAASCPESTPAQPAHPRHCLIPSQILRVTDSARAIRLPLIPSYIHG
eukprot:3412823-Rhodomonas_salina.2